MKTLVIILIVLLLAENSFGQVPTSSTKDWTKDYLHYLKKSKRNNTIAWILLGSGIGIGVTGVIQINHDKNIPPCYFCIVDFNGIDLAVIGGAMSLLSIPFFISSSKNKRKAGTLNLSNQQIFMPRYSSRVQTSHPMISMKITFGR